MKPIQPRACADRGHAGDWVHDRLRRRSPETIDASAGLQNQARPMPMRRSTPPDAALCERRGRRRAQRTASSRSRSTSTRASEDLGRAAASSIAPDRVMTQRARGGRRGQLHRLCSTVRNTTPPWWPTIPTRISPSWRCPACRRRHWTSPTARRVDGHRRAWCWEYPGGGPFVANPARVREVIELTGPDIYRTTSVRREVLHDQRQSATGRFRRTADRSGTVGYSA